MAQDSGRTRLIDALSRPGARALRWRRLGFPRGGRHNRGAHREVGSPKITQASPVIPLPRGDAIGGTAPLIHGVAALR